MPNNYAVIFHRITGIVSSIILGHRVQDVEINFRTLVWETIVKLFFFYLHIFNSIQFNSIFIGPTMEEIQFEYMQFEPDINHKFDKFNDYTL